MALESDACLCKMVYHSSGWSRQSAGRVAKVADRAGIIDLDVLIYPMGQIDGMIAEQDYEFGDYKNECG